MSDDVSTDECDYCRSNKHAFRTEERHKLFVCLEIVLLTAPPNYNRVTIKTYKKKKLEEIMRKVSALRNSGGGSLIIHMKGMSHHNRSTTYFNEFVDKHLNDLIEDGHPFHAEFFKSWYDKPSILVEGYLYLVLTVTGSSSVSTADYKTKLALDDCILRPTSQNMDMLLYETKRERPPYVRGLFCSEEDRNVQFKSIQPGIVASKSLPQLIHYIWDHLRLPEYITSFSSLPEGGSFYIGVSEVRQHGLTGVRYEGIPLSVPEHGKLLRGIYEKVRNEIICFSTQERNIRILDERNIRVAFHPVEGHNKFVVEIAVASASGCVFYDTKGPEAYVMTGESNMDRMTFSEWLKSFEKRNKKQNCKDCMSTLCDDCRGVFNQ